MHSSSEGIGYLLRGGFMMYPLLLSALVALTVIIERLFLLLFRYPSEQSLTREVISGLRTVSNGSLHERFNAVLKKLHNSKTPVASVLETGLQDVSAPAEETELSMQNRAEMWIPTLERRLDVLDTIITAAPLMGLLGTITGMMSSFQVLSDKGVNEPNAITGGVAEALIATATGLVIALCCLVAYNFLNNRVKRIIFEMESAGAQLLEVKRMQSRTAR